ncbi:hypothetical protein BVG16_29045 [Paenibacillus selenitireducens]|uniref:N-acetylglucosamine-6-phosphate deacetylase n=1 Tax=Paenibacillus selenitireducens TaxID=1324314 RepID=A0A1T2X0Q9_9BACL|nr:hypothetical protein [Paenibacillus selenitireducens]OPA73381.1 hypothetical protein BVG16_29045 [Paenibacillus selenitireducens]
MDTYIGKHYANGQLICITVLDGVIHSIVPVSDEAVINPVWIAPGLVDLQINGYAGIDMNQAS